ncbi:MAG: sodium ion-translocating decarboxylase subunit beta [Deltaproteobacteria bacterium]|nr:sodium ion-translocating decarboxylase subunit beta [Deltaproteobacteria bacterium]MCZ6452110.1 sodium ion-translocating decarboxylase subunit beta [Deltaproteobacteria bacterium]MCZ6549704.1 sodium ion-translocating decarboxylase subunit beta [Deltaproteobacteria bacterium]MCZ6908268.1 sodium ion-translocating decarboxylase subunit beta [Deltaproteobacteria bacterium]
MESAISSGIQGLFMGLSHLEAGQVLMMLIGSLLLYLGIRRGFEPLLLLPIGFGAILVNIPQAELMEEGGVLRFFYDTGILTEVFPILIFIGIGAMTDFQPLLENPKIILLGAAGQFGIFLTLLLALALGFDKLEAVAVAIIGACDGPTAIYVSSKYAPHLLGAVSVAAYSYMSLVPLIQPPIMRLLTTEREKKIVMGIEKRPVSKTTKILFPVVVTIAASLIAPLGTPLIGMVMLGNLMRESGVVERLKNASENEITNVVTLLLGLSIGATMEAAKFLRVETLMVLGLGFIAISLDTVMGVLFGKLMCFLTGGRINPLIGAAGISAFPMSARVVQVEGQRYNKKNYLLMHALSANASGQIGSIVAAGIMLSVLKGMGIV